MQRLGLVRDSTREPAQGSRTPRPEEPSLFSRLRALLSAQAAPRSVMTDMGLVTFSRAPDGSIDLFADSGSAIVRTSRIEIRSAFSAEVPLFVNAVERAIMVEGFESALTRCAPGTRKANLSEGGWSFELSKKDDSFLVIGGNSATPRFWAVLDKHGRLLEGDSTTFNTFCSNIASSFSSVDSPGEGEELAVPHSIPLYDINMHFTVGRGRGAPWACVNVYRDHSHPGAKEFCVEVLFSSSEDFGSGSRCDADSEAVLNKAVDDHLHALRTEASLHGYTEVLKRTQAMRQAPVSTEQSL